MSHPARVRVENKEKYNDPYKNFKEMFGEFKRQVSSAGVLHDYKEHQTYESKSEKERKKKREAAAKRRMEFVEQKILAGERVNAPAGLIKKIKAAQKKKNKKRNYKDKEY